MGTETELKFRIPPDRLAAVRRRVATPAAAVLPLAALYVDTPGQHLAAARMALRLRREGSVWVQTLKAEGASTLQRLEHNVVLDSAAGAAAGAPVLDAARHDGTAAGAALRRVLAQAGPGQPLQQRYATEVQRTHRLLRLRPGPQGAAAVVELALDEGRVLAAGRSLALCEIEFELVSGPPQALLALAARWAARFGLLLDVRSKSELGHTLAAGLPGSPAVAAAPPGAGLAAQLRPVLANASQLADGPATAAHLQQLQQGLAGLQAGLATAAPPGADPARLAALAQATGVLQAGLASSDAAAASRLLRAPATQQLWLALLGLGVAQVQAAAPGRLAATSAPRSA